MKQTLVISLLLILTLTAGCMEKDNPPNLIEEDTYINMLAELQLVKSYRQDFAADSSKVDSLTNLIYKKYNVTEEQFRESHNFYQEDPLEQKKRVDMAIERLRMDEVQSDSVRPWEMREKN